MRINLHRLDDAYHFVATNADGNEVYIDVTPEEGGTGQGAGPMQMLIMGLAGCSAIDVVSILRKGRQHVQDFDIEVDYEREPGASPSLFTIIHLHYLLTGDLDAEKVRRAVNLSLRTYCSAARILEKTATITSSFSVNGTHYE